MRFYKPAKKQPCYYCSKINSTESEFIYTIRDGIYTFEDYVYRCEWHSRFKCSICDEEHHFSWFYWCPKEEELICGKCTPPTLKPVRFWDRTYAYQFFCEKCQEYHYDLLYAEYQGIHPWQQGFHTLKSNVEEENHLNSLWKPLEERKGKLISLKEALTIPNRVNELRKDLKFTQYETLKHGIPEKDIKLKETQESWETNSEKWLELYEREMVGDINRQLIIDPALWKLCGDIENLEVLDAGCGNGYLSRVMATRGAKVTGVDFSKPFIEYSQRLEERKPLGCEFFHLSITDLSMFEEKTFDLVISNVVLVDIIDYKQVFIEIERVLKDNGRFIWSNVHPVFGRASGGWDPKFPQDSPRNEARYLKMIDGYFDSGGNLLDWMKKPLWQFQRTFEEYSKALKEAGFVISEIVEPRPTPEIIQQNPRALAFDADRWTHFVIFECLKRK